MDTEELFDYLTKNLMHYKMHTEFMDKEQNVKKNLLDFIGASIESTNTIRKQVFYLLNHFKPTLFHLLLLLVINSIEDCDKFKISIVKEDIDFPVYDFDDLANEFYVFFEKFCIDFNAIRFLDSQSETIELEKDIALKYFLFIVDSIQIFTEKKINDDDLSITIPLMLMLAGILVNSSSIPRSQFYKLSNLVIQIFNRNELYQDARNLAEELLQLSIKDNLGHSSFCVGSRLS